MMGSDEMLMVSTDYPHFDADSPTKNLPAGLSEDLLQKIRWARGSRTGSSRRRSTGLMSGATPCRRTA
jgi:hypothetical protein